ncbi:hypothetical protein SJAV_17990 [Sulfurisphaera javensis]|uniref:Uncharacterized protein n=1 Tax=Sulfurisphaera javensis TaxID=2049879 RepID=A0AAT9GT62_9CREN
MELTVLKEPEELLLALAKGELFNNDKIEIDEDKFRFKYFHFKIEGIFKKIIEGNSIIFLFSSRLGGVKVNILITRIDEYSCKVRLIVDSWGFIGRSLKSFIQDRFLDFIIDVEFKKSVSLTKKLVVKMYTNSRGLEELLSKLSKDSSSYYFLIIDKQYIIEIVNGIELVGEETKELCKDLCYIELYELKPNGI